MTDDIGTFDDLEDDLDPDSDEAESAADAAARSAEDTATEDAADQDAADDAAAAAGIEKLSDEAFEKLVSRARSGRQDAMEPDDTEAEATEDELLSTESKEERQERLDAERELNNEFARDAREWVAEQRAQREKDAALIREGKVEDPEGDDPDMESLSDQEILELAALAQSYDTAGAKRLARKGGHGWLLDLL